MDFGHLSVMAREAVELLGCSRGGVYVDGTLGGGGHTSEMLRANPANRVIGLDKDEDALKAASEFLAPFGDRVSLVREDFRNLKKAVEGIGAAPVDGVLLDIGVSSFQLDSAERGFSFRFDSPLDMRMDTRQEMTAATLVNTLEERELESVLREFGEEAFAGRIARSIVHRRASKPIETTGELVEIVLLAIPKKFQGGRVHPATKVFQALRIAVNDELESLKHGITGGMGVLKTGGRLAVITFHSLEDRIVKRAFREASTGCVCPPKFPICVCGHKPVARLLTRKAVTASQEELDINPRARSARLRAIEML
ncbi:MAG: 16S rRNA (cytosine(1402)-N(4))-methyltransferase RsmH [Deltaproteobacteria bacterium]|nr:16S rRNA (cytosine(1402)-N(4))-methyltransferase RsmH [Deltaproteobacteria bacterium]